MIEVRIKENSWLARLAAKKLDSSSVAMVVGRTIHLSNSTRQQFLQNEAWVRHEIAHVYQYKRLGLIRFLFLYLLESAKKGYYNNRFEVEARQHEADVNILNDIRFLS